MSQLSPNINQYDYTVEKLKKALRALVTGEGDARARLNLACSNIRTLTVEDFPPMYQEKWAWINKEVNKRGPLIDSSGQVTRGSVDNTMHRIYNPTALKIIKAIYELYWEVSETEK